MQGPADVVGTLADVFTWVGFGGAAAFGILALILYLADGTWLPARGVVETDGDPVVRWIDADGGVNEAPLSAHDLEQLGGADMADILYRRGWRDRMRLTPGSPAVRATFRLAIGLAALGIIAVIASLAMLAMAG